MKKKIKRILLGLLAVIVLAILIIAINLVLFISRGSKISEGIPIPDYEIKRPALLVVDLQGSTTGESSRADHYKSISDSLIGEVNEIIEASQAAEIPVIYIRSEISNPMINLIDNSVAVGSPGAQLDDRLKLVSELDVTKDRKDAFSNPKLDSILLRKKIGRLYVTGLDAAHCVNSTIQAARNRQYEVCVIKDAVVSESAEMKEEILAEFQQRQIQIISTEEYIDQLMHLPEH